MTFSIRFLLVLIVLSALGVNAWRMQRRLRETNEQITQLHQVAQDRRMRLARFDVKQLAYERFFAAEELRTEEFAKANPGFDQLANKYGQFDAPGGDQFRIVTVPTFDTSEYVIQSHRVYTPNETPVELRIDYVDGKEQPLDAPFLFSPREAKTLPLPPGEAVISFRWYRQSDPRGVVEVNGEPVFEFKYNERVEGYGHSGPLFRQTHTSTLKRPLALVRFTPGAVDEAIRLTLARQAGAAK